jgi:hypothetical protein
VGSDRPLPTPSKPEAARGGGRLLCLVNQLVLYTIEEDVRYIKSRSLRTKRSEEGNNIVCLAPTIRPYSNKIRDFSIVLVIAVEAGV